jgi:hypothetical protein
VCLCTGKAGSREYHVLPPEVAVVLACKYSSLLLGLLEGVEGCGRELHERCLVELQQLIATPEVSGSWEGLERRKPERGRKHIALLVADIMGMVRAGRWYLTYRGGSTLHYW